MAIFAEHAGLRHAYDYRQARRCTAERHKKDHLAMLDITMAADFRYTAFERELQEGLLSRQRRQDCLTREATKTRGRKFPFRRAI